MSSPVRVEKRGHVMEVTLDRPKVNAIDLATSRALGEAFVEMQNDPDIRCGIVTAAGDRIFCAGWDLKAAHQNEEVGKWWETTDYGPGGFAGLTELWSLNKPVIAAVNGLALGGGFELAIACDLIICAEHVEFALPELPIGIIPDSGGIQRVGQLGLREKSRQRNQRNSRGLGSEVGDHPVHAVIGEQPQPSGPLGSQGTLRKADRCRQLCAADGIARIQAALQRRAVACAPRFPRRGHQASSLSRRS
jgi:enoyl-CoA hydratase/carnithine racemase